MVLGEIINWFRDLLKFIIEHAPYPLKVAFWLFLFLGMATLLNFFFTFNAVCTTEGELYKPDSSIDALRSQYKRMELANNLNYTLVNSLGEEVDYEHPALWERVWASILYLASFGDEGATIIDGRVYYDLGDNLTLISDQVEYRDATMAYKYNSWIKDHATKIESPENELLGLECNNENVAFRVAGINIMNKELWLALFVLIAFAPLFKMALDSRRKN